MTRLENLEAINKEIQGLEIPTDLAFFRMTLPNKLEEFLALTDFEVANQLLKTYLDEYRNLYRYDTIIWCNKSEINETKWQKDYTLTACKRSTSDFLGLIKMRYSDYI